MSADNWQIPDNFYSLGTEEQKEILVNAMLKFLRSLGTCEKPCGPGDWKKGGYCNKNGCYYE